MEKDRSAKIIAIVALFVGVMGLTIGFSTFTSQVKVTSSAHVAPNSGDFRVKLSTVDNAVTGGDVEGVVAPGSASTVATAATADKAKLEGDKISGLKANFTAPGQTVTYSFYAVNDGEYNAWLKSVAFENIVGEEVAKKCVAAEGTTDEYVQAACNAISVSIKVGEATYKETTSSITGHKVVREEEANETLKAYEPVVVTITYEDKDSEGVPRADGDFTVSFGDIGLTYNSVD